MISRHESRETKPSGLSKKKSNFEKKKKDLYFSSSIPLYLNYAQEQFDFRNYSENIKGQPKNFKSVCIKLIQVGIIEGLPQGILMQDS